MKHDYINISLPGVCNNIIIINENNEYMEKHINEIRDIFLKNCL